MTAHHADTQAATGPPTRAAARDIPASDLFEDEDALPVVALTTPPAAALGPDLGQYEEFIVFFSGGKDSVACALHLLERGIAPDRIELHHHIVDGMEGSDLMDWPCTEAYCQAFARAFGMRYATSWKVGGFEGEMMRNHSRTAPIAVPGPDGKALVTGGERGTLNTRRKFPQVSANLSVRWCSSACKIEVGARYFTTHPRFGDGRKRLVITGERAEESSARASYASFERHRTDRRDGMRTTRWLDHWRAVHAWTEHDIWSILERHRVTPHPAYWVGLNRASCQFCIFGGPQQWATMRFMSPQRFRRIAELESEFGTTIHRSRCVNEQADRGTVLEGAKTAWRDIALSRQWTLPMISPDWQLPPGAYAHGCAGPT